VALESFVDGQLFRGTLYKASNWTMLGPTAGFGWVAEDFYARHARPKQLWVRLMQPQARAWLGAPQLPAPLQAYEKALPGRCELPLGQLASLRERLAQVSEFRKGQGKRHRIATVLAIAACAKMAGVIGGYSGVASYARNLTRPQRRALHCWFNPKTNEDEVPSESCFLRVLQGVSALEVEAITLSWQDQVLGPNTDPLVAIDGKTLNLLQTAPQLLPESFPPSGGQSGGQPQPAGTARTGDPSH
jgi:hypothetical protein